MRSILVVFSLFFLIIPARGASIAPLPWSPPPSLCWFGRLHPHAHKLDNKFAFLEYVFYSNEYFSITNIEFGVRWRASLLPVYQAPSTRE